MKNTILVLFFKIIYMKIRSLLLFTFFLLATSCNKLVEQTQYIEGELVHSVYFWLNNPDDKKERAEFEKALKKLIKTNKIAVKKHLGKPGSTEKRDVVDNSYDYCMILTFANLKAQRLYQDAPTHLIFIDEAKHLWKKVQVYDSMKESI